MFKVYTRLLAVCFALFAPMVFSQEININTIANALAQGPVLCVRGEIVRARVRPVCPRNFRTVYVYQQSAAQTDLSSLINQLSGLGQRVTALESIQPVVGPTGPQGEQGMPGVPGPQGGTGVGAVSSLEFRIGNIDQELFPYLPEGRRTMRTLSNFCGGGGGIPDFGCSTRSWGEACKVWGFDYGLLQDSCGQGWMRGPASCQHSGWCFSRAD